MWNYRWYELLAGGLLITVAFGLGRLDLGGLGLVLLGGLAGGMGVLWWHRIKRQTNRWDERSDRIQMRASTLSYSVLLIGIAALAAFLTGTDADVPIEIVLWVFVFGGILLDELFKVWYSRQM